MTGSMIVIVKCIIFHAFGLDCTQRRVMFSVIKNNFEKMYYSVICIALHRHHPDVAHLIIVGRNFQFWGAF